MKNDATYVDLEMRKVRLEFHGRDGIGPDLPAVVLCVLDQAKDKGEMAEMEARYIEQFMGLGPLGLNMQQ